MVRAGSSATSPMAFLSRGCSGAGAPLRLPSAGLRLPLASRSHVCSSIVPDEEPLPPLSHGSSGASPLDWSPSECRLPAMPAHFASISTVEPDSDAGSEFEEESDDEPQAPRHDRSAVMYAADSRESSLEPTEVDRSDARLVVESLPLATVDRCTECAICFEEAGPQVEGGWRRLPCGHAFHSACLRELAERSRCRRCPLCRTELPAAGTPRQLPDGEAW